MLSAKCRWLWGPRAPDAHCAPSVPQTGPARPLRPQASAHLRVFRLSQGHPATCERSRQRQCHTRSCPHRPDRETGPGPSSLCLPTPQLPHRKGPTILGGPGPSCSATPSPRLPSPCPSGTKARCTHRLAVPSGGAILPWRAWGSLRPRDKSCIGAGHQRACGVLGGECRLGATRTPVWTPAIVPSGTPGWAQHHAGTCRWTHRDGRGGRTAGSARSPPGPAHVLLVLWPEPPRHAHLVLGTGDGEEGREARAVRPVRGHEARSGSGPGRGPHLFQAVLRAPNVPVPRGGRL